MKITINQSPAARGFAFVPTKAMLVRKSRLHTPHISFFSLLLSYQLSTRIFVRITSVFNRYQL